MSCAACIPDFELSTRRFVSEATDAEAQHEDASPADVAAREDANQDATPPPDAAEDGGQVDADDAGRPVEICNNGMDDDHNGHIDCDDPACGPDPCNDHNDCTDDTCNAQTGACLHTNNGAMNTVQGWRCDGAVKHETLCNDAQDNDDDMRTDCQDEDCCMTALCRSLGMGC